MANWSKNAQIPFTFNDHKYVEHMRATAILNNHKSGGYEYKI